MLFATDRAVAHHGWAGYLSGPQVTVQGHRHRDPKRREIKTERVIWGERLFNVYPDRR